MLMIHIIGGPDKALQGVGLAKEYFRRAGRDTFEKQG